MSGYESMQGDGRIALSVLVVDDEPGFRRIVREILETYRFVVHEAGSVAEAQSVLQTVRPDVILVDVMMPETGGLSLVQALTPNPEYLHVPIVVTSANVQASNKSAAWMSGADAFLPKPFMAEELLDVIEYVLGDRVQGT